MLFYTLCFNFTRKMRIHFHFLWFRNCLGFTNWRWTTYNIKYLPDLAQKYSSNNDSVKCSDISAVTWFRNRSSLFRNLLRSNQQSSICVPFRWQKGTGKNISIQTYFLKKNLKLSLKELLLLMLRYTKLIFTIPKFQFLFGTELLIFQKNP